MHHALVAAMGLACGTDHRAGDGAPTLHISLSLILLSHTLLKFLARTARYKWESIVIQLDHLYM